eukprot:2091302-Prymnesium_polylepis.1
MFVTVRDVLCAAIRVAPRAPGNAAPPAVQSMPSNQLSSRDVAYMPLHETGWPFDEPPAPTPHASHQDHAPGCAA